MKLSEIVVQADEDPTKKITAFRAEVSNLIWWLTCCSLWRDICLEPKKTDAKELCWKCKRKVLNEAFLVEWCIDTTALFQYIYFFLLYVAGWGWIKSLRNIFRSLWIGWQPKCPCNSLVQRLQRTLTNHDMKWHWKGRALGFCDITS